MTQTAVFLGNDIEHTREIRIVFSDSGAMDLHIHYVTRAGAARVLRFGGARQLRFPANVGSSFRLSELSVIDIRDRGLEELFYLAFDELTGFSVSCRSFADEEDDRV